MPVKSSLSTNAVSPVHPPSSARAVTPNDSTDLPNGTCRGLLIGGAGNVSVIMGDDTDAVTLTGLVAGSVFPGYISRVRATNTTATSIVALY